MTEIFGSAGIGKTQVQTIYFYINEVEIGRKGSIFGVFLLNWRIHSAVITPICILKRFQSWMYCPLHRYLWNFFSRENIEHVSSDFAFHKVPLAQFVVVFCQLPNED